MVPLFLIATVGLMFSVVTAQEKDINVTCTSNSMTIHVGESSFPSLNFTFNDVNCKMTDSGTKGIIQTDFNQCGTVIEETDGHIKFKNNLTLLHGEKGSVISRQNEYVIAVSCDIERSVNVSTSGGINATAESFYVTKNVFGTFKVEFKLYTDATFVTAYTEPQYPISVKLQEDLHNELSVDTDNAGISLIPQNCYATPSASRDDATKYQIITDRCPVDTTYGAVSTTNHKFQFKFQSFQFISQPTVEISVHCEVVLCPENSTNAKCTFGCGSRKRRSNTEDEEVDISEVFTVSSGRILILSDLSPKVIEKKESTAWYKNTTNILLVLVALVLIFGFVFMAMFIRRVLWRKQQQRGGSVDFKTNVAYVE